MKPFQTLLFLCAVGLLSGVTAWVFPTEGIEIGEQFSLKFAAFPTEADTQVVEQIADVEAFLEVYEAPIDSTAIKDSIRQAEIKRRQALLKIQWADENRDALIPFFKSLESLARKKNIVRIMHYGDSQIEGDRITGKLRNELQKTYGGSGAGLVPAVEAVPNAAIQQTNSNNWHRYTLFGRPDTNVTHNRYGPLFSFGTYKAITDTQTTIDSAWISFETSKLTYFLTRKYYKVRMGYGHNTFPFILKTMVDDSVIQTEIIPPTDGESEKVWTFDTPPNQFKVAFIGKTSPEVYYFSFEPNSGVVIDNIGLRGSSGTLFKKTNGTQLAHYYQTHPVDLMILQFGGNSVPYIKSTEEAERYARWFGSQLSYLKRINPHTAFILIGPSDMTTKVNGTMMTYPYLEDVRDALKSVAFAQGCGYWDLYEVMGGKNSMISWVEAEKPLAGKDYVHFNNAGTKKVAELFAKALWFEKAYYETQNSQSSPTTKAAATTIIPNDSAVIDSTSIDSILH